MEINESLIAALRAPSPAVLRQLHGDLLQAGIPPEKPVWQTLDRFHEFLVHLYSSLSAHEYSQLATLLDIGAVGGVALEGMLAPQVTQEDLWKRLLIGGLSEGLMVLASRQYVKAFHAETTAVYESAAWFLQRTLWLTTSRMRPELGPAERRQLIEGLLAPVRQAEVDDSVKAVLLGRLFQILLLLQLAASLPDKDGG